MSKSVLAIVAVAIALPIGCSFSTDNSGNDDPEACKKFVAIATDIESGNTSAPGLESALEEIHSTASDAGQEQVAAAAEDLISAVKSKDNGKLYDGLGEIEAACGPLGY